MKKPEGVNFQELSLELSKRLAKANARFEKFNKSAVHQPKFHPTVFVTSPSFVVDIYGHAWWIDPETRSVRRAAETI